MDIIESIIHKEDARLASIVICNYVIIFDV